MITTSLILNLSLLVSLSLLHGLLMRGFRRISARMSLISGGLFGSVAVMGMMAPVHWSSDIFFDGRSIILSLAGFFGGPLTAGIAVLFVLAYRIGVGGAGVTAAATVIICSAVIGTAGFYLRKRTTKVESFPVLYGVGLAIHLTMMACMFLLPVSQHAHVMRALAFPVLGIFPLAFMLIARSFIEIESHFLTEAALRLSESRNRALLDALPDTLLVFNREGTIVSEQRKNSSIGGLTDRSITGLHLRKVFSAEVAELLLQQIEETAHSATMVLREYDQVSAGELRHYESRMVTEGNDRFVAIVRDVSKRHRAMRELRESRALYEDLIQSTLAGIYRMRETLSLASELGDLPTLEFEFLNDRLSELTDIPRDAFLGNAYALLQRLHPDDVASWREANLAGFRSGTAFAWDGRLIVRGEVRWLHFWSYPSEVVHGVRRWTGVVVDIHARVQKEEEQQELDRRMMDLQKLESLGILAGGMAHDFNNILMAIMGHTDLALMETDLPTPVATHLTAIGSSAQRAAELSRQMLAYSGHGRFVIETLDLSRVVAETVQLLQLNLPPPISLKLELAEQLPLIDGDFSQLSQIVVNLVTNAVEATEGQLGPSNPITIRTGAGHFGPADWDKRPAHKELSEGEFVYLEVEDHGCGMSAETLERLFEPFYTTKFTGRGLGLPVVQGIVKGHQGAIQIRSGPQQGATIRLFFPLAVTPPPAPTAEPPNAALNGETNPAEQPWVLLVDDEESLRVLGKAMLKRLGYQVITAADGQQALELFQHHPQQFSLVLLDLTMPHMDGEEAYRLIKLIDPEVRILLCSGYAEDEIAARFAGKSLAGFIQKPYTLTQLADKLAAAGRSPAWHPSALAARR